MVVREILMGKGLVREFETNMNILLYLKWITNEDLLYSTWNSAQCGSLDRREIWGRMTTYIVAVVVLSLSYVQQTLLYGLQHTRLPYVSSLSPWVCSNSCLMSRWCHPTISSSLIPFSSCPQSFLAQGLFQCISLNQVAKVLELQLPHQSFQWIFRADFL